MINDKGNEVELTNLESLQGTYSDIYKDVYGVRPRHDTDADWNSESFLQDAIDRLVVELGKVMEQEKADQKDAIARFEAQMALWTVAAGGDRSVSLRWVHDAEDTGGDNERLCYELGLPYGYFKEAA